MAKDFDRWNDFKKEVDGDSRVFDFHEREIWWCSVGVNIGREQQSQTGNFSRPILVTKRFTPEIFLAVPLTTKIKKDRFRFAFRIGEIYNDALILHMRSYDKKRLIRKVCMMSEEDFKSICSEVVCAVSQENEIPLTGEISEAEANVPTSVPDAFGRSSETETPQRVEVFGTAINQCYSVPMITKEDVQKLASLSRLKLSEEEIARFQGEMSSILAYVDKLKEVTGSESGPVMSVNRNVLREDADPNESGAYTRKLVDAAPRHEGDYVKVKKILS